LEVKALYQNLPCDISGGGAVINFFLKTRGRTVDICGRREGQIIVAITLPPKVGRVWRRRFFRYRYPVRAVGRSKPVFNIAATLGKTTFRTESPRQGRISGLYNLNEADKFRDVGVFPIWLEKAGSSIKRLCPAPQAVNCSMPLTLCPRQGPRTVRFSSVSASRGLLERSSQPTVLISPLRCSAKNPDAMIVISGGGSPLCFFRILIASVGQAS